MSAARRSRNPLRWLERKLFAFYGPADVRDIESRRAPAPAPVRPPGPETVTGETVPRAPGVLGGGPDPEGGDEQRHEVVRGELAPPAVGPAPDADATGPRAS